jgi:hypothetical protein
VSVSTGARAEADARFTLAGRLLMANADGERPASPRTFKLLGKFIDEGVAWLVQGYGTE